MHYEWILCKLNALAMNCCQLVREITIVQLGNLRFKLQNYTTKLSILRLIKPWTKNVDIKFSVHYAFMESPSSGMLKITFIRYAQNSKFGKPNDIQVFVGNKAKGLNTIVKIY